MMTRLTHGQRWYEGILFRSWTVNVAPYPQHGRIKLEFHDTLSTSGVLGKGIKLLELNGVTVPVQANFTVLVNNKPVVVDSHGREWYLDYTAHTDVKIVVDGGKVAEDIATDLVANVAVDAISGAVVGSAVPVVGTAGGLAIGLVVGLCTNFGIGYALHHWLGWP